MGAYKSIELEDLKEQLASKTNVNIIDVRMPKEFNQSHVKGAINIPFDNKEGFEKLNRNKTYFLYCRVGGKALWQRTSCKNWGLRMLIASEALLIP